MEKINLKNPFLEGILKKVKEEQKRIEKEQKVADEHYKKALKEAVNKEGEIHAELEEKYKMRDQLVSEYAEIEKEVFAEAQAEVEADAITKEKVKRGEKSLAEFFRDGKDENALIQQSKERAMEKLDKALDILRSLNVEILDLELQLAQTKVDIYGCILFPGRSIIESLRKLKEYAERQISLVTDGYPSASQELKNLKDRKLASERKFLSAGFAWPAMLPEEARMIIPFDPVLPRDVIPRFYEIMEKVSFDTKGSNPERIQFTYFWRNKDLAYSIVR